MGHVHFSHFVPFPLFVSQPERKNEGNQISSKLKKDSLQDGKHTMGVSHRFPVAVVRKNKTAEMYLLIRTFLLLGGCALFYIMLSSSTPDLPVLLIQLCDRSRGSSSLIPLPQMRMWSS